MQRVLILGAGKIGALISGLLAECLDYEVHVADVNGALVVDTNPLNVMKRPNNQWDPAQIEVPDA